MSVVSGTWLRTVLSNGTDATLHCGTALNTTASVQNRLVVMFFSRASDTTKADSGVADVPLTL